MLVQLRTRIDMSHQTVKVRKDGKTKTLNPDYDPGVGGDTKDDFTSDSEKRRRDRRGQQVGRIRWTHINDRREER